MASEKELRKIKKTYGERFMKMCRTHFPTILESEEKLYELLQSSFSDSSGTLYEDIQENDLEQQFVDYIFEKFESEKKEPVVTDKTPYELLDEAGYVLTECHNERGIQSFKKYYANGEELCTFRGERLEECVVFWVVKKNVAEIKRKDFKEPKRDDEYGTSVMSIQFNKTGTTRVSIKNRYNHTVDNPDATLGNDLEKIIPGLSYSFEQLLKERGLNLDNSKVCFGIPSYIKANDGKYYKYNSCIGDTYYCPDNIVIVDGEVQTIPDPEKRCLIDCFLIDMEKKTISMCDESYTDAFLEGLMDIQKISIVRDKESGDSRKYITIQREGQEEPIVITVDTDNQIIGYKNHALKQVGNDFLAYSWGIESLDTPNIEEVGDNFCYETECEEISLPKLRKMGNNCFSKNMKLRVIDFSVLEEAGDNCFRHIEKLEKADFSKLRKIGNDCFYETENLRVADFPELEEVGKSCLFTGYNVEEINAPKLKKVGDRFARCTKVVRMCFPELEEAGDDFASSNPILEAVDSPKLKKVGEDCLLNTRRLKSIRMQSLEKAGEGFLAGGNKEIIEFETPKISRVQWLFSKNRHVVSIINRARREQRINRKDIAHLDRHTELLPEEVKENGEIIEVEPPTIDKEIEDDETLY